MEPMVSVDRGSPLPLWAQVEADLRRRMDRGEFADRFPTDEELVDSYEVSRHTAREAIRHLHRSGILRRERGRGTVVNRSEFEQPLGTLYSLFRSVESSGALQRSTVIDLREEVDPAVAQQLELAADTPLLYLARLRYADDEPLANNDAFAFPAVDVDLAAIDGHYRAGPGQVGDLLEHESHGPGHGILNGQTDVVLFVTAKRCAPVTGRVTHVHALALVHTRDAG